MVRDCKNEYTFIAYPNIYFTASSRYNKFIFFTNNKILHKIILYTLNCMASNNNLICLKLIKKPSKGTEKNV